MRILTKKRICKLLSLLLTASFLLTFMAACADKDEVKEPVLEYGEEKLPLYFYEFMLSRMRATLARNKYDVDSDAFWSKMSEDGERTYEEYCKALTLKNCKNYFAAAVLFDKEGLTLSESRLEEIDEEIAFYIDYDGNKDKEKFNELISKYGVDVDELRKCYIIEAKYQALVSYYYGDGSLVSAVVKEEFYKDNYYRFKQVLFPRFYYEYERDSFGDIIYFDDESGNPLYDTKNGKYKYDEDGNRIKDKYGVDIYYGDDGEILYDTEKGKPSVTLDKNGEGIKYDYTDAQVTEQKKKAEEMMNGIEKGDFDSFDSAVDKNELYKGYEAVYPDGYYLSDIESSAYIGDSEYLGDILSDLKEMSKGEMRIIESDFGYHLIMKYELDDGKSTDSAYAEWFKNLNGAIINELFLDKIKPVVSEISVNDENLKKAKSIKNLGTNFNY